MTTLDTHIAAPPAEGATVPALVAGWLTTADHKRIGRIYLGAALLGAVGVAVLGVLLGVERASSSSVLGAGALPQINSMYAIGLTYLVLLPAVIGVATVVVPLQVGARSIALPRAAATGLWSWLLGAIFIVVSIAANGGPTVGDSKFVSLYLLASLLCLIGATLSAGCVAATVLTTRAPGMNMRRVPLFSWSALIASLGLLVTLPTVAGLTIYTYVDHRYGRAGFGGNAGLLDWIGFGHTQPATFVPAVVAFGILAEVVATATGRRQQMRGTLFAGIGLVGAGGVLGAALQGPTAIAPGVSHMSQGRWLSEMVPYALVNLVPLLGAVVAVGLSLNALRANRPRLLPPLAFAVGGALLVLAGVAANALQQVGDAELSGTSFEEGARLLVGYGLLLAVLGAVVYWVPKWRGVKPADMKVLPLGALAFAGAALAALPMAIAGFPDDPPRIWWVLSLVGHGLLALAVAALVGLVVRGEPAGDDPWDGHTLEWATSSPPPPENYADVHVVSSPEPLLDLKPGGSR